MIYMIEKKEPTFYAHLVELGCDPLTEASPAARSHWVREFYISYPSSARMTLAPLSAFEGLTSLLTPLILEVTEAPNNEYEAKI